MTRIASILVLVVVTSIVQGAPTTFEEFFEAAKERNWAQLQDLLKQNVDPNAGWTPSFNNIRNLKPPEGGQVYGEAEYTFQSSSNINGQKNEESAGHKVINDNGKVDEFDFNPTGSVFPKAF